LSTDTLILAGLLTLAAVIALGCAVIACVLWLRGTRRTALQILLCLPLAGVVAGFPVGFYMDSWQGLQKALRFGAIVSLGCGNGVGLAIMLVGLLYLAIAGFLRRKSPARGLDRRG
jgi:hypothetical protein